MRPESRKFLYDIFHAADLLSQFTEGKNFADYSQDEMLRSAVERQFEIIGEAISQLSRIDLETASQIDGYQRIIAFRNILIHGYAQVDDRIVWGLLQTRLPELHSEVKMLLGDDLT
jgi:uncharacterized protein with HEPN domain